MTKVHVLAASRTSTPRWIFLLALLAAWGVSLTALAQPGTLDAAFGSGGSSSTSFGLIPPITRGLSFQTDGKIIVAGSPVTPTSGGNQRFGLMRFTATGSIDPSFGVNGYVETFLMAGKSGINDIYIYEDDKILVGGTHFNGSNEYFAMARYEADGALDPTFGTNGIVLIGNQNSGADLHVLPNGKILMCGYTDLGILLMRFNANGTVDNTFGPSANGSFFSDQLQTASNVVTQSDGKILLAAWTQANPTGAYILRLSEDGILDPTFGVNGVAFNDLSGVSGGFVYAYPTILLKVQADDKIIVSSEISELLGQPLGFEQYFRPIVRRLDANGALDTGFGVNGYFTGTMPALLDDGANQTYYSTLELQENGKILFAYGLIEDIMVSNNPPNGYRLVRLQTNGTLDTGFGVNGEFKYTGTAGEVPTVLSLQEDGKIVIGGDVAPNVVKIMRLNGDPTGNGTVGFAVATPTQAVNEGNSGATNYTFNVTLADAQNFPVTVEVALSGDAVIGSAISSSPARDYSITPVANASNIITLTFNSNSTQTLTVRVVGNTLAESDNAVIMTLQNPSNQTKIENANKVRTLFILNDDGKASLEYSTNSPSTSVLEGNSGITSSVFNVRLINAGDFPTVFTIDLSGTASYPSDYATTPGGATGSASFSVNANGTYALTVKTYGDITAEMNETVNILLASASPHVTINADNARTLTITNDDGAVLDCSEVPFGLNVTNITDNSATLNWNATTNAASYEVRYRFTGLSGIDTWTTVVVTAPTTTLDVADLAAASGYTFNVRAVCGSNIFSNYSSSALFSTTGTVGSCEAPTGFVSTPSLNGAVVSWNAVANANYYNLRYRAAGAPTWTSFNVTGTSYTFVGLTSGVTYEWMVRTRCGTVFTGFPSVENFTTLTSKVGDLATEATATALTLYPNPNNGQFSFETELAAETAANYRVFDLTGKQIVAGNFDGLVGKNLINVDLGSTPAGLYFLEVKTADSVTRAKFQVR